MTIERERKKCRLRYLDAINNFNDVNMNNMRMKWNDEDETFFFLFQPQSIRTLLLGDPNVIIVRLRVSVWLHVKLILYLYSYNYTCMIELALYCTMYIYIVHVICWTLNRHIIEIINIVNSIDNVKIWKWVYALKFKFGKNTYLYGWIFCCKYSVHVIKNI